MLRGPPVCHHVDMRLGSPALRPVWDARSPSKHQACWDIGDQDGLPRFSRCILSVPENDDNIRISISSTVGRTEFGSWLLKSYRRLGLSDKRNLTSQLFAMPQAMGVPEDFFFGRVQSWHAVSASVLTITARPSSPHLKAYLHDGNMLAQLLYIL